MKRVLKYLLYSAAALFLLVLAVVLIVPSVVSVERYKPRIEQLVTDKTGYALRLNGDISLSVFPWIGLSFTDLTLANPGGFESDELIEIDSFQARMKLVPLFSKKVEITKFIVERPQLTLEKNDNGIWNWQHQNQQAGAGGTTPSSPETGNDKEARSPTDTDSRPSAKDNSGFALASFVVGEFYIADGRLTIIDQASNSRRELSSLNVELTDVSLTQPIQFKLEALLDGQSTAPLQLFGTIGPVGNNPGKGDLAFNSTLQAFDTLKLTTSGIISNILAAPGYELTLDAEPFNPKNLIARASLAAPLNTADPEALNRLGVHSRIKGTTRQVSLSETKILLDDSTINLELEVDDFSRPSAAFSIDIDSIDLDRYLPPPASGETTTSEPPTKSADPVRSDNTAAASSEATGGEADRKPTPGTSRTAESSSQDMDSPEKQPLKPAFDYAPLRELQLDGTLKVGSLRIKGGLIENISTTVHGDKGLLNISPFTMQLYNGSLNADAAVDFRQQLPGTALTATLESIQVGPLLREFAKKDILEGQLNGELSLNATGDQVEKIRSSLNGTGDFLFKDGAIIGLDLAQLARKIQSGFTLQQQGERPKTDFAELHAPFTITNGLVFTPETSLKSPFIRATLTGKAHLVDESLDLRIRPKLVGTIKGQGDTEERSGISIPVRVSGTFASPSFSPDLGAIVKEQNLDEEEIKEILETGEVSPERKEQLKEEVDKAKSLLKGLFGT